MYKKLKTPLGDNSRNIEYYDKIVHQIEPCLCKILRLNLIQ